MPRIWLTLLGSGARASEKGRNLDVSILFTENLPRIHSENLTSAAHSILTSGATVVPLNKSLLLLCLLHLTVSRVEGWGAAPQGGGLRGVTACRSSIQGRADPHLYSFPPEEAADKGTALAAFLQVRNLGHFMGFILPSSQS